MTYTLGEAAKATGKSKSTILRAIRMNKVSANRNERNQGWIIEPAELHRVYPPVEHDAPNQTHEMHHATSSAIMELRLKLEAAMQRLDDKEQLITELRDDRDHGATKHNQAQRLALTDQRPIITPPPATEPKARRWSLFGKRESA